MSRPTLLAVVLAVGIIHSSVAAESGLTLTPEREAAAAAIADGVSTLGALSSGAVERNAMLPASPVGIVALTVAKVGLTEWANQQPEPRRSESLKSMTAVFGGAAVNNLFVLAGAANPVSLVAGLTGGIFFWNNMEQSLKEQALAKAAQQRDLEGRSQLKTTNAKRWSCPKPKSNLIHVDPI